jgi:hypothetical protein
MPSLSNLSCDICMGNSGGKFVGVFALTSGPMSVAYCDKCASQGAEPSFAFDYLYIHVANGKIENLRSEVLEMVTWVDGAYIKFRDYIKRITPEQIEKELRDYNDAISQ